MGECAPKSNVLLGETNWENRTATNLIVQEIAPAILSQLRDDQRLLQALKNFSAPLFPEIVGFSVFKPDF